MTTVNVRWYNTVNKEEEEKTITGDLPLSVGRTEANDIVLPQEGTGVADQHGILVESGKEIIFVDTRQKQDMGLGRRGQDIKPGKPFNIGFYRLTVTKASKRAPIASES